MAASIVDGTGSPGFHGAIGVEGDSVAVLRGDVSARGGGANDRRTGLVVCPGFIDLHSHAGLTMLGEPHHDPKVRQGVTTELIGIDGISHSPFRSARSWSAPSGSTAASTAIRLPPTG